MNMHRFIPYFQLQGCEIASFEQIVPHTFCQTGSTRPQSKSCRDKSCKSKAHASCLSDILTPSFRVVGSWPSKDNQRKPYMFFLPPCLRDQKPPNSSSFVLPSPTKNPQIATKPDRSTHRRRGPQGPGALRPGFGGPPSAGDRTPPAPLPSRPRRTNGCPPALDCGAGFSRNGGEGGGLCGFKPRGAL